VPKTASTTIPLLDLHAQYAPLRDKILTAVARVCDSQRYIMGPEVTAFEEEIASLIGVSHAVSVSSGTDALLLALMAQPHPWLVIPFLDDTLHFTVR